MGVHNQVRPSYDVCRLLSFAYFYGSSLTSGRHQYLNHNNYVSRLGGTCGGKILLTLGAKIMFDVICSNVIVTIQIRRTSTSVPDCASVDALGICQNDPGIQKEDHLFI